MGAGLQPRRTAGQPVGHIEEPHPQSPAAGAGAQSFAAAATQLPSRSCRRREPGVRRRGGGRGAGAHSPSSPRPAARPPLLGAGALGSFRRRRCRALPRALRHLRQFPSGPGRHFLAACVARWLRGSVLGSEALSGSAMDGYVAGPVRRCV